MITAVCRRVRRAAFIVLFLGGLCALAPLCAFAAGTVTLAWDPSPGTNVIANYNIYYGAASATYTNVVAAGTNTTVSISKLVGGTTYYFAATAVDTSGLESDFSTEVSTLIPINVTNQPPTLNALANVTLNENAGLQTVNLSGITSGATNEVQTLKVTASSSNPSLIPTPAVNYTSPGTTGSISFTPVAYAYGYAIITVTVNDGGTSNNIVSRTFTATVNPVNQAPTLNALANVILNENAGLQIVNLSGITSGATNEVQTLTVTAASSNTGLIPTPAVNYASPATTGSISFTPVASAFGSATITVTVNDGGTSNNIVSRTFTVTVNGVNQAPTLNALANVTLNENASLQTVNLSGITSGATNEVQTLTVTASSSNTGLIPTPEVNYTSPNTTGSITFAPVASAFGSATITVTVNDGGASNNIVTSSFTITVNPVNQAPTLNALANVALNENASLQTVNLSGITSGATNEVQTLTVTASSSNTGLIPTPAVNYTSPATTGSISFTPVASAIGSATITVTVNDGGASNNIVSRTFTVTVNRVNQAPTLNALANITLNENAGLQTVNLSGITSGATNEVQKLTVAAFSSNTGLIPTPAVNYTSPATTGSISFTPVASAFGSATITVTVNDGGLSNNIVSQTFTVTVVQLSPRPTTCTYALSVSPTGFTANAASGTFSISTDNNCVWSVVAPLWLSLSSTNGTGAYAGTFTVDANTGLSRTGLVSVTDGTTYVSCSLTQQALVTGAVALVTPPDGATLQAPPPQFSWSQSDPAATNYYVSINCGGSNYLGQWSGGATNWTAPTDLPAGNYTWAVEAWNSGGGGTWSTNSSFTIQTETGVPNMVTLVSPAGSATAGATQRYTWKSDPAATMYELYITENGQLFLAKWFTLADSVVDTTTGSFVVDVSGHGLGAYQWWVQGWSPNGYGPWSSATAFTIGAVSLVTPTNNASLLQTRRPQFSWSQSDPAATMFEIDLYRNGSLYLAQWIEGTTNWTIDTDLPGGNYTWWVDPWGPAGYGPWSTNSTFTIQGGVPNAVALISPSGSATAGANQRYTWKTDPAATMYELYISKDGQLFLAKWFTLADSVVDITTGSFAVDVGGHSTGAYQWWVQGWSPDGYGSWSDSLRFQIP